MIHTQSLKQNHLFRRVYQRGKVSAGKYVVVYCRRNGLDHNRLGITAGSKVGKAVVRNKVRRRIREAYRLSEASYRTGFDVVVVARARAASAEYADISGDLRRQSEKLGLVRKEPSHEAPAASPDPVLPE